MNSPKQTGVKPEVLALMVDLLPTIGSLRDLCGITGLRQHTIRHALAPFLAIMKLQGTHPKCGCGRDRFHPYGCKDSVAKIRADGRMPGRTPAQGMLALEKRMLIVEQLVAGDRHVDIDRFHGFSKGGSKWFVRYLTPAQKDAREVKLKRRGYTRALRSEPKRPFSDPLYARIAAVVPRWVTDATREDIISEMYVAVSEGSLREIDMKAHARRFASAAVAMWESKFGPRSLDERAFDDGTTTIGDMIPDPRALAAFDRIRIGEPA